MNRGYIKFWRKAQDSASWNRGLMYQGLMINFLTRASWKETSYQGHDIHPGQFGVVMSRLAESLGVSRGVVVRMVNRLLSDGFLSVENVNNRFTIITIVNWDSYQENELAGRTTDEQPTDNRRSTDRTTLLKEEKEVKKERINTPPLPPTGGREVREAYSQNFLDFWAHYPRKVGKDAAWKAWKRVKKTIPKPEELAAILERQKNSDDWRREGGKFIPHPATWLNGGRWKDEGLDAAVAEEQFVFPQWAVPKPPTGPRERILVDGVWQ